MHTDFREFAPECDMTIEIRQLTVHSQVSARAEDPHRALSRLEIEALEERLRSECRQMVQDLIRAERER